jgi:hypothetical protein
MAWSGSGSSDETSAEVSMARDHERSDFAELVRLCGASVDAAGMEIAPLATCSSMRVSIRLLTAWRGFLRKEWGRMIKEGPFEARRSL